MIARFFYFWNQRHAASIALQLVSVPTQIFSSVHRVARNRWLEKRNRTESTRHARDDTPLRCVAAAVWEDLAISPRRRLILDLINLSRGVNTYWGLWALGSRVAT
jgi:hypothetical protein